MLTKNDLEKLSQIRLDDAIYLLQGNKASSSYYLSGYCIELAFKACISKLFQANVIPDNAFLKSIYSHRAEDLVKVAGLHLELIESKKKSPEFSANWAIVCQWTETSRYELWDPLAAATMLAAVSEPNHGVFQWIKSHW